ncbi:MAG TPA: class I SAM-dependent methyltransferase [Blastocatellia bacterium]|nr:class I SAM-dependent methyltransferase [Blastocatellia bacterium]
MTDYLSYKNDLNDPALASAFDELSFWSSKFGALLLDNIEIRRDAMILDLGCGNGFPSFELANLFGASSQVTGMDIWREGLDRARSKQRFHRLANLSFVEADGASMPFPDCTFDMIVSNVGLNNFADPQAVLAECRRVLREGGALYLTTNVKGHFAQFYEVFRRVLTETDRPGRIERLDANEKHRGTSESIAGLLGGAGFAINRMVEKSFDMRFADGSAVLNHFLVKLGFLEGWKTVVGPDDEKAVFERVEELLNEEAAKRGELRMTVPMLFIEAKKPGDT